MCRILLIIFLIAPLLSVAQEPSVEILGVPVSRGMEKQSLIQLLPGMTCSATSSNSAEDCTVSDGVPPGADGEIFFDNEIVASASRNHFFPESATPFDVALMIHEIILRLVGENRAVCAKIEANPEVRDYTSAIPMINPGTTMLVFPEKVLIIIMHTFKGEFAFIRESLRANPVPKSYRVFGDKRAGREWCGYVN